jgi:hypothetical protein
MDRKRERIRWSILGISLGMLAAALSGCQVDVSGAIGAKAFYPDRVGKESYLGDPRRPMYEGSGYAERHTAGGESGFQGFRKLEGD